MKVIHYKNLNKYGIKRDKKRSKTNTSGNYDEKYMRIKFNSDDDFPSKKTELHNMVLIVRSLFMKATKITLQVLLDECLHK